MAVTKYKTFADGEVLTAADLNASFDRIFDNQDDLANPRTETFDLDGQRLVIDASGNMSLISTTTNKLDVRIAGQDLFDFDGTVATPVNGLSFAASAAGSPAQLKAKGSDTNIGIHLVPKGTGGIVIDADADSSIRATSDDVVALRLQAFDGVIFDGDAASPVNGLTLRTAATTVDPEIASHGSDSNINTRLTPKGTGVVASANGFAVDGSTALTWRWVGSGTSLLIQENTGTPTSPTWTTRSTLTTGVGISSGAKALLQTYSPSAATSVDITSQISSSYNTYEIDFVLRLSNDNNSIYMRTDTSNGASFDSGASDYSWHNYATFGAPSSAAAGSDAATEMRINTGGGNVGNATNEGISGRIVIRFIGSASLYPLFEWKTEMIDPSTLHMSVVGGGCRRSAAAINAVQLFPTGGTFTGTVKLYGVL